MNIPVLMYHGLSYDVRKVPYGFLLQPADQFESCLSYLAGHGYTTITLRDLHSHLRFNTLLPDRPIILTFDDGYLDNWVYGYPILKKYGFKATIFVVPEFVDPGTECRPNLDDAAKKSVDPTNLKWWGYLSWAEMRRMEADGVMDIQSHTLTHTWYFKSDKIVDFHHPSDSYAWLAWNQRPQRKFAWVDESQEEFVGYGAPVYESGRSLGTRRYFEDPKLTQHLVEFVQANGGTRFFKRPYWRRLLSAEVDSYKHKFPLVGKYETDDEYRERLRTEIADSKTILEKHLQKQIQFLCWPGGAHTEEAHDMAIRCGYLATSKGEQKNTFGTDPSRFHRTATYLDSQQYSLGFLRIAALPMFVLEIQTYQGHPVANLLMRAAASTIRTSRFLTRAIRRTGRSAALQNGSLEAAASENQ